MTKKQVIGASNAAASFFSIKAEPETPPAAETSSPNAKATGPAAANGSDGATADKAVNGSKGQPMAGSDTARNGEAAGEPAAGASAAQSGEATSETAAGAAQSEAIAAAGTASDDDAESSADNGAAARSEKKRTVGRKKKEAADDAAKGYITRTYYITRELDKQLGHFCIEQGMDKSSVVRASLQAYMKKYSEK